MKSSRVLFCALSISLASVACTGLASSPQDVIRTPVNEVGSATGFDVEVHLTNQTLATQAELIVIGECTGTDSVWIDRNLYTLATIAVSETLKGDSIPAITVALPGGVDANRRFPVAVNYPGAARISPQETVFLFLTGANDELPGGYSVMGSSQGKFAVIPGRQGPVIARNRSGLRLLGNSNLAIEDNRPMQLSVFKEEIRSYLKPRQP